MTTVGMASALDELGATVGTLRQELHYLDVAILSPSASRESVAQYRSSCYVWAAASLESFVQALTEEITDELSVHNLTLQDLRLSLLTLVLSPSFDSLQMIRGLPMWKKRVEMMSAVDQTEGSHFIAEVRPTDGRTIRPAHLQTLWEVFGFDGDPLPGPLHRFALEELAENRNELAHGRTDSVTFGRLKVTGDVLKLLDRVEDIAIHLYEAAEDYLNRGLYRR